VTGVTGAAATGRTTVDAVGGVVPDGRVGRGAVEAGGE
jgi:hypothetical protein